MHRHSRQQHRQKKLKQKKCIDIEQKAEITFDDFEKLQFQVGEIIACEAVKKSKKLLCSQVKIGNQVTPDCFRHQRSIIHRKKW